MATKEQIDYYGSLVEQQIKSGKSEADALKYVFQNKINKNEREEPGFISVVVNQLAGSLKRIGEDAMRQEELVQRGESSLPEQILRSTKVGSYWLTVPLETTVGTIGEYVGRATSKIPVSKLIKTPIDQIKPKETWATQVLPTIGEYLNKIPERWRENAMGVIDALGFLGQALVVAKTVSAKRAINKGLGKKIFEQAAGITGKKPNSTAYIEAIKAAANNDEMQKIIKLYVESNGDLSALTDELAGALTKMYNVTREEAEQVIASAARVRSPGAAGEDIATALKTARKEVGKKYGEIEQQLFDKPGAGAQSAFERFGSAVGSVKVGGGSMINARINKALDKIGESIGFKIGETPSYTVGVGGQAISLQQQQALNEIKKIIAPVETFEDLVRARRHVKNMIDTWGVDQKTFYAGAKADRDWLSKNVYAKINEIYRSEAEEMIGGVAGAAFRKQLEQLDEFYSEATAALRKIEDGIGASVKTPTASLRERLSRISAKDFEAVSKTAEKIDELKPVVNEIRAGINEELLFRAIDANGKLNVPKFANEWRAALKEKPELLNAVLGKSRIDEINKAIAQYESKTAALEYFTPDRSVKSMQSAIENITSQARVREARELQFIDNMLGLSGDNSFYTRALRFAHGKELGMNRLGQISRTPLHVTGKATYGGVIGGAVGAPIGYFLERVLGLSAVGSMTGLGAGVYVGSHIGTLLSSPAGNLWLYKTLSNMPTFKAIALRSLIGGGMGASIAASQGDQDELMRNIAIGFLGGAAAVNIMPSAIKSTIGLYRR